MWTASVASSSLCIQRNEDIWLDFLLKPFFLPNVFHVKALRRNELFSAGYDKFVPQVLAKKIQIMVGKVCLRGKGKTLLGIVNKLLKTNTVKSRAGARLG